MATRLNPVLARLLKDRRISHSRISKGMLQKELSAAESDHREARDSLKRGNTKWATIQGYYSTFHSARAVLYSKGYREKSHRGLLNALRELSRKELSEELLDDFEDAMGMREAADYGNIFSEEGAEATIATASEFLEQANTILKGKEFDRPDPGFKYNEERHEASRYPFGDTKKTKNHQKNARPRQPRGV